MKLIKKIDLVLFILILIAVAFLIGSQFYFSRDGFTVELEETKNEYFLKDRQGNVTSVTKEEWLFIHNLEIVQIISGCMLFVIAGYLYPKYILIPMMKRNIRKAKDFLAKIK